MSRIKRVHCGDVNCHLVQGEQGAILVDTGRAGYGEKLLPLCRQWDVRLIVLTHGHLDHVQNAAFLSQQLEVPIAMHRADLELLEDNDRQPMQAHRRLGRLIQSLSRRGFQDTLLPPFQPDLYLEDGDDLSHFGVNAQVVALPGHTAGSIGLKTEDGALLVGDAMFRLFSPAPRPGLCGPAADGGQRGQKSGPSTPPPSTSATGGPPRGCKNRENRLYY